MQLKEVNFTGTRSSELAETDTDYPFAIQSMTRINDDNFILATYQNLYLWNKSKNSYFKLQKPNNVKSWHPTGVFFSPFYQRLFVANYTGNDLLVLKIQFPETNQSDKKTSSEFPRLILEESLVHTLGIKGAEGIFVSPMGRYMSIANFDGKSISFFERLDNDWKYRWSYPLPSAHGTVIVGNSVYGSGTSIVEIDLETGKLIKEKKSIGQRDILFTTCINYDFLSETLIVSDTMAGKVSVLSKDLDLISEIGENGPGPANLDMPYCSYRFSGDLYILSTFQRRIIEINSQNQVYSHYFDGGWKWLEGQANVYLYPSSGIWERTTMTNAVAVKIGDLYYLPDYGSLRRVDGQASLYLPTHGHLLSPKSAPGFYIVSIAQSKDYLIIIANSSDTGILLQRGTGRFGQISLEQVGCWALNDRVMCPRGEYSLQYLVSEKSQMVEIKSLKSIADSLSVSVQNLESEFTSDAGLKFLKTYKAEESSKDSVSKAAKIYFSKIKKTTVPFMEFIIISALNKF
ncbi:hypothetical protein BST81_09490 [Leptolyngbya sp. 'hensonii']|nr:hypothetical protein BST81_09490 [Leptolyngbya sp. 'hensonii']